ncbi:MAG: prephenate dehydrogenase/arogenate dehydrogenase family protein [Nitriliruptoraceae bacterium]
MVDVHPDLSAPPASIGVIGTGLIGGSIVRRLRALGRDVIAYDHDAAVRGRLADAGARVAADAADVARRCELVVLAVPPGSVATLWSELLAADVDDVTVIDVASSKGPIAAALRPVGEVPSSSGDAVFVATHPMAGRVEAGFDAALDNLFVDAAWIIVPHAEIDVPRLGQIVAFIRQMGARPCFLSVADHERFTAVASHLPHLLAFSYRKMLHALDADGMAAFAGGSLGDVLRVADADPPLWREILAANDGEIARARDALIGEMTAFPLDGTAPGDRLVADDSSPTPAAVELPSKGPIGARGAAELADTGRTGQFLVDIVVADDAVTCTFAP